MKIQSYILVLCSLLGLVTQAGAEILLFQQIPQDTTASDTLQPYEPSRQPTFQPTYRFGDPFANRTSRSPLFLSDPSQLDLQVQFNPDTLSDNPGISYSVFENIGNLDFRPATTMTFQEFNEYNNSQLNKEYFKERSIGLDGESAVSGRSLIPRLYISPVFDRIFGGSYVDIQPNGFVNLDFGARFQRLDNPAIPRRQQRNGGFNFDQQISMNVVGKVGEKLAITANFDNNNTFDFQNNMKVEYTGYEEDIIKKIEIGNVSMPVSNSLITGAQSLFGVKTELQFGRLWVTAVASQQRGRNETLTIESGFQGREFDIQGSDYDENRHFFLGQFFRDNYERWLATVPQITSGVNINRVEVYVLNRNNETRTTRNIVALMDLGEGQRIFSPDVQAAPDQPPGRPASNRANSLFNQLNEFNVDAVDADLEAKFPNFQSSTDYVKVTTARKLDETEYTVNKELGYITLLRRLQSDEVLAVSYQYSFNGPIYQVGEIQSDYSNRGDDEVIYLKMLRPNQIATELPTWDLMMKNIYNLNSAQVSREGFQLRVIYRDDVTGQDNPSLHEGLKLTNGRPLKDKPLIEVFGLDQLNQNNDRQPDANFDFIEGVTIDTRNGNVIFPVLEPFGSRLEAQFDPETEGGLIEKYVYDELYSNTKAVAERDATKNKFVITGKLTAGSSSEVALPGINIAEGSVVVTAGGTLLTEGLDYNVDYNLGVVRILNDGILNSGKQLNISYEKADLFNFQTRTLTGARFDYRFSENFNIGGTVLHLNERPGGISRFAVGSEPTRNTKYGFDINFQQESRFLTKMVDALPLVSTKERSNVIFNAEFAQLIPGTSNIVNGEGTSYIDDFENAVTPINIGGWQSWQLASTPRVFDESSSSGLDFNNNKAKIAWYTVDNSIFYRSFGNARPSNISDSDLENHYERPVLPQEIFPQRDPLQVQLNEPLFDIAYFPSERGQYNYNAAFASNPPDQNWGGVTRAITNEVNFQATNIQYLEFWLMDPFIEGDRGVVKDGIFNTNNTTGGELIFNLGSVSEDVAPDDRHAFENGLPTDGEPIPDAAISTWGQITTEQYLTNFFANTPGARDNQDVGLDGLRDEDEGRIPGNPFGGQEDPSADNFTYILDESYDALDAKIVQRYKSWNGMEGNSPISADSNQDFIPASTTLPDNEDINNDNTISDLEEYFEYRLPLRPGQLRAGEQYIIDEITANEATWYLYRIPIQDVGTPIGTPSFENIKYIRMYLTGFSQPVVLRMAKLQLVGSQWLKSAKSLREEGLNEVPNTNSSDFQVSVVSIEENSTANGGSPYVLPPGLDRDIDNTTVNNRRINEQSLQVCVEDLDDKDARAVYKNVNYDLINYGRMKMFLHAEAYMGDQISDDELTGFIRLGTDEDENYYEVEVPLKITPQGVSTADAGIRRLVWPLENEIDISINELIGTKSARNRARLPQDLPFRLLSNDGKYNLTIKGNPDISAIKILMLGVRNPGRTAENISIDDGLPKSVCVWANELRVTDFDRNAGWAANARLSTQLADLGTISASTRYTSIGFGTVQQRISERTREETRQFDISANINVDKFLLPQKTGLVVPMFVSYEKTTITPQFDPLDPDVPLEASLETLGSEAERDAYRRIVEDRTVRRSINFTNVRKQKVNPDSPKRIYDIENFSFNYAYSDQVRSNSNTQSFISKSVSGGVNYNYSPSSFSIEPFKNSEFLSSPYLALIKDVNLSPIPSNFTFSGNLRRDFRATQYYNNELTIDGVDPVYERLFTFVRNYSLRWDVTKSLGLSYTATANAVIDEPEEFIEGDISTKEERRFIWDQILNLGRMKNFDQSISANYKFPLDKFPLTDWISADVRYAVGYGWIAGSIIQPDGQTVGPDSLFFGNFISNQRDRGINSSLDLSKLYSKATFLKNANTPKPAGDGNIVDSFLKFVTMLKSVNGSYNIRESTSLPGFRQTPFLLGLDSGWNAPGFDFILGSQDPGIRTKAAQNGWLIENENLNSPFQQTFGTDVDVRADFEPFNSLKIQLSWNRGLTNSYQEIFRFNGTTGGFETLSPTRTGNYSSTFLSINTAFEKETEDNFSDAFAQFERNLGIIRGRLNEGNPNAVNNGLVYDTLAQDVLIPAFISAYSGQSAEDIELTPFPKIPLPNWRVDFTGLSKIPALQEVFSSITISHGYNSTYSVSGFNNLIYDDNLIGLQNDLLDYPFAQDSAGRLVPVYLINQAMISEQFVPLVGINVRTVNNISTRIEFRKSRSLALNMSNAQVTETNNNDITLDFGYTATGFKFPWRFQGRTVTLENDLTIRISASIRDSRTVQRKIDDEDVITNGSRTFQMRPTFTYKLNDQLDLSMYFERNVTEPKVLSSFRRATSAFGIQLRFGLSQ